MTCEKGRVSASAATKRRLFAKSGGYCQRADCNAHLFPEDVVKEITVAEIAHIIAATDGGPRADMDVEDEDRAAFENLILLCPTCHTIIDKAPEEFPVRTILEWKREHEAKLRSTFEIAVCDTRNAARAMVESLFDMNHAIFIEYGPENDYRNNPEAEQASVWKRKMRAQIIPNNERTLLIIDTNRVLLTAQERMLAEQLRQHTDDLIEKHVIGTDGVARRFPIEITGVFT